MLKISLFLFPQLFVRNDEGTYPKCNGGDRPVICLVRHSSPFGRLLNRSSFEYLMRHSPSSLLKKNSRLEDAKDLLKVEIGTPGFDKNIMKA